MKKQRGVNEGNTNNKTDNGLVEMQSWEESTEQVLWCDDDNITLLVYSLLRATEDGKIAPNQDIDFDFPVANCPGERYGICTCRKFHAFDE